MAVFLGGPVIWTLTFLRPAHITSPQASPQPFSFPLPRRAFPFLLKHIHTLPFQSDRTGPCHERVDGPPNHRPLLDIRRKKPGGAKRDTERTSHPVAYSGPVPRSRSAGPRPYLLWSFSKLDVTYSPSARRPILAVGAWDDNRTTRTKRQPLCRDPTRDDDQSTRRSFLRAASGEGG